MKAKKVIGTISVVISFVFFILMVGFVGGIECDNISFWHGTLGAFSSLALWIVWLVLADRFFS